MSEFQYFSFLLLYALGFLSLLRKAQRRVSVCGDKPSTIAYFKPCTVPFALRDKVDAEIQRLEKERVLKKVEISDWATPIVPVLQPDEKEFVVISK